MGAITKVAVIGSGVMGSAIAAHIANAGTQVLLMDIVPEGEKRRNALAEQAIEKLLKTDPAPLTHKRNANLITPANIEDNLDKLSDVDWIIEAIVEKSDVKQALYQKIDQHRKKGSIISSNTSTLPLSTLTKGMPEAFKKDFLITHFFNPPRYMRLLEIVSSAHTRKDAVKTIEAYADIQLGKGIVHCNDTPGFIANRIGCFWLTIGVLEAIRLKVSVEEADAAMSRPIGVPKTGVFGLLDLIGIDLMPLIAKTFSDTLPEEDAFRQIYQQPDLVQQMIADGYTGRKGKGGFYRLNTEGAKKTKEIKDLQTGEYYPAKRPRPEAVKLAKQCLRDMLLQEDELGQYAKSVLVQLLGYTASLVPEVSDDIVAIDEAMKLGYNWKYGPFELIDKLAKDEQSGAAWISEQLVALGQEVPDILHKIGNNTFYSTTEEGARTAFCITGEHKDIAVDPNAFMLSDVTRGTKPIKKNASSRLWDIGDGIVCLEYTSKMNSVDPLILEMIMDATKLVAESDHYKGLVIANDADNFCVGANIGLALFAANVGSWKVIEEMVENGQKAYMGLKYAPFPVVTAVSGMALGGGCELLMHSDAVQAHIETYTGLVEVGVGIIPGWGGCKEMLLRTIAHRQKQGGLAALGRAFSWLSPVKALNTFPAIKDSFMKIGLAKVAKSAVEAQDLLILNEQCRITMNRKRLLADAKHLCLELAQDYQAPEPQTLRLPGKTARSALYMGINDFVKSGKATPHDEIVSKALADVLSGGDTDITQELTEQDILDLERKLFMQLVKTTGTLDRMEHMLETGKPLRN